MGTLSLLAVIAHARRFHVERLRTEYAVNPIGIDEPAPRLSWMLHSDRRGTLQSAYEIRVARDAGALTRSPPWTSGRATPERPGTPADHRPALRPGRADQSHG